MYENGFLQKGIVRGKQFCQNIWQSKRTFTIRMQQNFVFQMAFDWMRAVLGLFNIFITPKILLKVYSDCFVLVWFRQNSTLFAFGYAGTKLNIYFARTILLLMAKMVSQNRPLWNLFFLGWSFFYVVFRIALKNFASPFFFDSSKLTLLRNFFSITQPILLKNDYLSCY